MRFHFFLYFIPVKWHMKRQYCSDHQKKREFSLLMAHFFPLVFQNEKKKKPSTKSGLYNPATLGLNIQHILMIEFYLPLSLLRRLKIALAAMCLNISLVIQRWIFKIFAIIYMEIRYEEMKKKRICAFCTGSNQRTDIVCTSTLKCMANCTIAIEVAFRDWNENLRCNEHFFFLSIFVVSMVWEYFAVGQFTLV